MSRYPKSKERNVHQMKAYGKLLSVLLTIALLMSAGTGALAASPSSEISEREIENAAISQYIATQGMVLLENNGALPIAKGGPIALFGGGAVETIKGGTGSGDVNNRDFTTVWEGFEAAGYDVVTTAYLEAYEEAYTASQSGSSSAGPFGASVQPDDIDVTPYLAAAQAADTALYVIARNSGEGSDRSADKLDYYLGDQEYANLETLAKAFDKVIVVLNVGGVLDTSFYREIDGLDAMLLMSQPGQQAGDALVQVLNGEVSPSGKLTDTWALDYADYPSSATFAGNDGDIYHEIYAEDIYVGYRYFDTFGVDVAYPFGYGLSYTDFDITVDDVTADAESVAVTATVTNTGDTYAGKEVVQVYFSAPNGELDTPYQELAAYGKTDELAPGESQTLTISYDTAQMSSYSMERAAYILQPGWYVIRVGNSSRNTEYAAVIELWDGAVVTEQLSNQMTQDQDIDTLNDEAGAIVKDYGDYFGDLPFISLSAADFTTLNNASPYDDEAIVSYVAEGSDYAPIDQEANPRVTRATTGAYESRVVSGYPETVESVAAYDAVMLADVASGELTMEEFVGNLTAAEMSDIVEGTGMMGMGSSDPIIGAQSNAVSGAAGETTANYFDAHGIPDIVLSDGPAGIRINQSFTEDGVTYYQFCTAFPIGTMIAQTWDPDIMRLFGETLGSEMVEYGITLWLAPGMNIHRNPLCGRNFEYYSEDPLVAGLTAGYTTLGVQSHDGIGVTLKHYAANNQESNRNSVNNSITERALREIYLKGFEIAIKMAQPMALMTCYNVNNSMPAADDYDLCTDLPRGEWGFQGLIMTDWGGGQSTPANSMHAGNDLIEPGGSNAQILAAYENGSLPLGDLQKAAAHVLNIVMQSAQFEALTGIPVGSYSAKFDLSCPVSLVKGASADASAEPASGEASGEASAEASGEASAAPADGETAAGESVAAMNLPDGSRPPDPPADLAPGEEPPGGFGGID